MTDTLLVRLEQLTSIPGSKRERKRLLRQYPGVLTAVTRRFGVRIATVSQVYHGRGASAKLTAAIIAEFNRRIEVESKVAAAGANGQ